MFKRITPSASLFLKIQPHTVFKIKHIPEYPLTIYYFAEEKDEGKGTENQKEAGRSGFTKYLNNSIRTRIYVEGEVVLPLDYFEINTPSFIAMACA